MFNYILIERFCLFCRTKATMISSVEQYIELMNENPDLIFIDARFLASFAALLYAKVSLHFSIEYLSIDPQALMMPKRSPLKEPFDKV